MKTIHLQINRSVVLHDEAPALLGGRENAEHHLLPVTTGSGGSWSSWSCGLLEGVDVLAVAAASGAEAEVAVGGILRATLLLHLGADWAHLAAAGTVKGRDVFAFLADGEVVLAFADWAAFG